MILNWIVTSDCVELLGDKSRKGISNAQSISEVIRNTYGDNVNDTWRVYHDHKLDDDALKSITISVKTGDYDDVKYRNSMPPRFMEYILKRYLDTYVEALGANQITVVAKCIETGEQYSITSNFVTHVVYKYTIFDKQLKRI